MAPPEEKKKVNLMYVYHRHRASNQRFPGLAIGMQADSR